MNKNSSPDWRRGPLLMLLILLLMPWPGVSARQEKPPAPHVILISIDGLKPEYYTQADRYKLKIPNLRRLCRQGSFAEGVETIYPSLTYPSHTTIVTGVKPARHGIFSNHIWHDPGQQNDDWFWYTSAIKTPTLWSEARKAGLKTAAIGWPVTVGAEIDYNLPEIWHGTYDNSLENTIKNATPGLVEKILPGLPPTAKLFDDETRTRAAEAIINNYQPNLLLLHI